MRRPPQQKPEHIHRFLRTLRIFPRTRQTYFGMLRPFQLLALNQSGDKPPSVPTLCRWAKRQHSQSPLYMVHNYARLIDRFLGWMTSCGLLSSNPFEDARQRYQLHSMTPIVKALLSEDYKAALASARGLAPFASFLGVQMRALVVRMRSLGYRYGTAEVVFLRFDRFLQTRPDLAGSPLRELVEVWSRANPTPHHVLTAQKYGRALSKAMHRLDSTIPVLAVDMDLKRRIQRGYRRPYIFTHDEIRRLLEVAQTYPSPNAPLRPISLYTMLVLAYCAGLRIGEIARLTLADVHLDDRAIEIRESKFFKSRRLPLAPGTVRASKCAILELP